MWQFISYTKYKKFYLMAFNILTFLTTASFWLTPSSLFSHCEERTLTVTLTIVIKLLLLTMRTKVWKFANLSLVKQLMGRMIGTNVVLLSSSKD